MEIAENFYEFTKQVHIRDLAEHFYLLKQVSIGVKCLDFRILVLETEHFPFYRFLSSEREQLQWKSEGLPSDQLSIENALVILQVSHFYILFFIYILYWDMVTSLLKISRWYLI